MVDLNRVGLRKNEGNWFGNEKCLLFLVIKWYWLIFNEFKKFMIK